MHASSALVVFCQKEIQSHITVPILKIYYIISKFSRVSCLCAEQSDLFSCERWLLGWKNSNRCGTQHQKLPQIPAATPFLAGLPLWRDTEFQQCCTYDLSGHFSDDPCACFMIAGSQLLFRLQRCVLQLGLARRKLRHISFLFIKLYN